MTSVRISSQRCRPHQLQLEHHRVADVVDLAQQMLRRVENFCERAEPPDQRLGQIFRVAPRNSSEQDKLKQFVVRHGIAAAFREALAQPLPMARLARYRLTG